MPEVERDRCRSDRAFARVREEPGAWLVRGLGKLAHTFGHESAPAQSLASAFEATGRPRPLFALAALSIERLFWVVLFGLAIGGAVAVISRRDAIAFGVLVGPSLGLALLHFATIGGDRYHPAVVPSLAALAAISIVRSSPRGSRAA